MIAADDVTRCEEAGEMRWIIRFALEPHQAISSFIRIFSVEFQQRSSILASTYFNIADNLLSLTDLRGDHVER